MQTRTPPRSPRFQTTQRFAPTPCSAATPKWAVWTWRHSAKPWHKSMMAAIPKSPRRWAFACSFAARLWKPWACLTLFALAAAMAKKTSFAAAPAQQASSTGCVPMPLWFTTAAVHFWAIPAYSNSAIWRNCCNCSRITTSALHSLWRQTRLRLTVSASKLLWPTSNSTTWDKPSNRACCW